MDNTAPSFHPQWVALCKKIGRTPMLELPIERGRALMKQSAEYGKKFWPDTSDKLDIEMRTFQASDGVEINARVYIPKKRREDRAVCAYFHGGGWSIGNLEYEEMPCRHIALDTGGIVVVSIDMRLAPEYPFPRPFLDVYEGAKWAYEIFASGPTPGNPSPFFVAGFSSGGNLAAAVTLHSLSQDDPPFRISGVLLSAPSLDATGTFKNSESWVRSGDGPILSRKLAAVVNAGYAPPPLDRKSPLISPVHAPPSLLRKHPPIFIATSTFDPLHDEAHAYAKLLTSHGAKVRTHNFEGLPHGFWLFPGLELDFYDVYKDAVCWLLDESRPTPTRRALL